MPKTGHAQALACILFAISLSVDVHAASAPSHDQMLSRLIRDVAQGHVPYEILSPSLAEAVRLQAATAQSALSALGALKCVTLESTEKGGMEIYRSVFEKGALQWAFHVDDKGLIDNAIYRPARVGPS